MHTPLPSPSTPKSVLEDPTLVPPVISEDVLAAREERYPIGAAISREILEDGSSSEIWHRLMTEEPITWCPAVEGWLVTKRSWAQEIYRSPEHFTVFTATNLVRKSLGEQMLSSDGERHDRQRRPFEPPFKARPVRDNYEDIVRSQVQRGIDAVRTHDTIDIGAWASGFAVATIAAVLGMGEQRPAELRDMYDAFASAMIYGVPDEADRLRRAADAKQRFAQLLYADLQRIRDNPDDSIISRVAHEDGSAALGDEGIIQNVRLILFGAIETVESMISNTLWLLLNEPATFTELRNDRSLIRSAVEESLRLVPPVGFSDRYAATELDFHGAHLQAGEMILPVIIAINRDPDVFPEPDRFNIHRENARSHYSLSHGKHFCLGANLARLEGELVLEGFLDAFPTMSLASAPAAPAGFEFRRVSPVQVRLAE